MTTYTIADKIYTAETAMNENGVSVNAVYRLCGKGGAIGLIGLKASCPKRKPRRKNPPSLPQSSPPKRRRANTLPLKRTKRLPRPRRFPRL